MGQALFFLEYFSYQKDLSNNFGGGQMTNQASLPGETESASHGAPRLSGDAQRQSLSVRDQHAFYGVSVCEPVKKFFRAVRCMHLFGERREEDPGPLIKDFPVPLGEIGHPVKGGLAVLMDPLKKLFPAKGFHPEIGKHAA